MNRCVFCTLASSTDHVYDNPYVYAIYDQYPVSPGHMLIIPKRHVDHLFQTTEAEQSALFQALAAMRENLIRVYDPDGFNIGINEGKSAGQTISHLHIHLIPRYEKDVDDPRGGIRGAIPDKRIY
ncbi:MAG: HIT family protein [Candidatus Izemoplasmatales bacterium]|nr:HIT family protein [Candidatus Izemoplasmatales bacterium]MDD5292891.1 HIT family protein [Candidatus Izemoplasmatales bacterium]